MDVHDVDGIEVSTEVLLPESLRIQGADCQGQGSDASLSVGAFRPTWHSLLRKTPWFTLDRFLAENPFSRARSEGI